MPIPLPQHHSSRVFQRILDPLHPAIDLERRPMPEPLKPQALNKAPKPLPQNLL